jgi:hypothetical protein
MSDVWKGVALPWGPDLSSFIEPKDDTDVIKSSVLWILLTRKGERVMRPEFGTHILSMVFDPNDPGSLAAVHTEIQEAIHSQDERVELVDSEVVADPANENQANIKVMIKNAKDPLEEAIQVVEFTLSPTIIGG